MGIHFEPDRSLRAANSNQQGTGKSICEPKMWAVQLNASLVELKPLREVNVNLSDVHEHRKHEGLGR